MDITLIRLSTSFSSSSLQSFNPCFNGYYTYTSHAHRHNNTRILVSILVLMDITLILISFHLFWINVLSFNPCFNGYYTYTFLTISASSSFTSFNPCFNGYYTYTNSYMEYTFMGTGSFNPCFNGYYTYTQLATYTLEGGQVCFNPCFNGYYTYTRPKSNHCNHTYTAILKIYNLQKIYQKNI